MTRRTLLDFFGDLSRIDAEFIVFDDGYRTWSYRYGDVAAASRACAVRLRDHGISKGHAVVIWCENRAEWIIALWGCLLDGAVLVPIDYRASADFLMRVAAIVDARAIIVGDAVAAADIEGAIPVWHVSDLRAHATDSHRHTQTETATDAHRHTQTETATDAHRHTPTETATDTPRHTQTETATDTHRHTQTESRSQPQPQITADDTAEIIFTSGATAEPKGVVITHRNILANIVPIEHEVRKYERYIKPFLPIRFLNLLPLSHMFGQAMATFVPPMLPGMVLFTRSYAPEDIVRQIRERRVSVLVCVPKMLEVLRDYLLRVAPEAASAPVEKTHWVKRWWMFRRIHRMFGFKFWAMVVGAAPLDPELEAFWGRIGFLVIQGYGLTETAPIVTLNHPLRAARGAVGKPIPGVEVKIAEDGEILVRGENVTRGYFNAPDETRAAFRDGWFHTGDIGEFDENGRLHIRGRKKEMIVTPEGLNVFPEDVERVLNELAGVRESAVVGAAPAGSTAERVHAVLVLEPGADVDEIVRLANTRLQDHQKIRAAAVWPSGELPRTEGTRKIKRRELRSWLQSSAGAGAAAPSKHDGPRSVASVLQRFAPGREISRETTIDELGLSSLERVELMMALEEAFQVTVDESRFSAACTVGDLEQLTKPLEATGAAALTGPAEQIPFPTWNRWLPARALRRASLPTWILPLSRVYAKVRAEGLENLRDIKGPVIFAANHQSHFDTPAIFDALPPRWRNRVAPAMAKEFFKAHFYPEQFTRKEWFTNSLNYYLASLFFNAFPLPQRETGTRQTLRYIGELIDQGYSLLIYPEGKRTEQGEINPFRPGVAMIAARLGVPVVPVRLEGLDKVLHLKAGWPTPGSVRVAFGRPMLLTGHDYPAMAQQLEDAVRAL